MKKTKIGMLFASMIILSGCGVDDITKETKDYYLIASNDKFKNIQSIPKGKCSIELRGKHSYGNLEKSATSTGSNLLKNTIEENRKSKYTGCIDSFKKEEIEELILSDKVVYIQYAGKQNPLGALEK